jgi:hypothetical protein
MVFNMVGGAGGGIKLESIAITTPPDNITYLPGEVFDPAGMVVTASYSNGATLTATGWTYSPSGALPEGTSEVEIIYTEAGVTKTAVQAITVERGTISVPTVSGSLTYNGQAQSPTLTGYDADKMVLSGDTSGTNAGSYTAVVTPTAQYKWADGSTEAKNIQWSIAKATTSITFDPTSVSLDTSTTSQAVAVTYTGDGTLSAQSDNSGVATASLEGTTLTVTGVETGNTAIQVSASEGTNYTAASASLSVAVQFAIIIPMVPSQKGTLTYNGEAQRAEWNDLNSEELILVGASYQTNAGTYTMGFQPKPGYQWWDGTTETKNATWTIGRAPLVVSFSPRSSPSSPLVLGANNKTAVVSVQTNAESTTFFIESQQSKEYISTNVDVDSGTITISALKSTNKLAANSTVFYVHISAGSNYTSSAQGYYVRVESLTSVFGVSWDSSNPSTALTRLTKANDPNKLVTVDITTEPVPAVGTGSGSSPFDSYMPWMGMEEVDIDASGRVYPANRTSPSSATCVKIPQFYYKVEKSGNIFRYYVADGPIDGFSLHPGSESYVARYEGYLVNKSGGQALCSYSNTPAKTGLTRADFRNYAKNFASNAQLYDFAAWCAVGLLYRVEYADWGSQEKINRGIVNDSSVHKTGETDAMVYHTGRAAGGLINTAAVQYRWIENPWGNVFEWIDGINVNNRVPYICTEPESYADDTTSNYTSSGITLPNSGWIKGLGFSSVFPWALLPDTTGGGSATTYIPDYINSSAGWSVVDVSGCYTNASIAGLFFFDASQSSGISSQYIGARLQFREVKS